MSRGYFITGTDTDVGKTVISAALVHAIAGHGHRVAGMKPVASGCYQVGDDFRNSDADLLVQAANLTLDYDTVCPYRFVPAIAPHLAAEQAGVVISKERILDCYRNAASQADRIVVEGVGGWMVPVANGLSMADIAVEMDLPVIMVVGARLGCINHALLTQHAIASSGLSLAGWIYNRIDPDMEVADSVKQELESMLDAPLIADIAYSDQPVPELIAGMIKLEAC